MNAIPFCIFVATKVSTLHIYGNKITKHYTYIYPKYQIYLLANEVYLISVNLDINMVHMYIVILEKQHKQWVFLVHQLLMDKIQDK